MDKVACPCAVVRVVSGGSDVKEHNEATIQGPDDEAPSAALSTVHPAAAPSPAVAAWAAHAELALWMSDCSCGERSRNCESLTNLIQCESCASWQHASCAGVVPFSVEEQGYECARCEDSPPLGEPPVPRGDTFPTRSIPSPRAACVADALVARHNIHALLEICERNSVAPVSFDKSLVRSLAAAYEAVHALLLLILDKQGCEDAVSRCKDEIRKVCALTAENKGPTDWPKTTVHLASASEVEGASLRLRVGPLDSPLRECESVDLVALNRILDGKEKGAFFDGVKVVRVDREGPLKGQREVVCTRLIEAGSSLEYAGYLCPAREAANLLNVSDPNVLRRWADFAYSISVGDELCCLPFLDPVSNPAAYFNDLYGPDRDIEEALPNASFCEVERDGKCWVVVVALCEIKTGEIVWIDYGAPYWELRSETALERADLLESSRWLNTPQDLDQWADRCTIVTDDDDQGAVELVMKSFPYETARWSLNGELLSQPRDRQEQVLLKEGDDMLLDATFVARCAVQARSGTPDQTLCLIKDGVVVGTCSFRRVEASSSFDFFYAVEAFSLVNQEDDAVLARALLQLCRQRSAVAVFAPTGGPARSWALNAGFAAIAEKAPHLDRLGLAQLCLAGSKKRASRRLLTRLGDRLMVLDRRDDDHFLLVDPDAERRALDEICEADDEEAVREQAESSSSSDNPEDEEDEGSSGNEEYNEPCTRRRRSETGGDTTSPRRQRRWSETAERCDDDTTSPRQRRRSETADDTTSPRQRQRRGPSSRPSLYRNILASSTASPTVRKPPRARTGGRTARSMRQAFDVAPARRHAPKKPIEEPLLGVITTMTPRFDARRKRVNALALALEDQRLLESGATETAAAQLEAAARQHAGMDEVLYEALLDRLERCARRNVALRTAVLEKTLSARAAVAATAKIIIKATTAKKQEAPALEEPPAVFVVAPLAVIAAAPAPAPEPPALEGQHHEERRGSSSSSKKSKKRPAPPAPPPPPEVVLRFKAATLAAVMESLIKHVGLGALEEMHKPRLAAVLTKAIVEKHHRKDRGLEQFEFRSSTQAKVVLYVDDYFQRREKFDTKDIDNLARTEKKKRKRKHRDNDASSRSETKEQARERKKEDLRRETGRLLHRQRAHQHRQRGNISLENSEQEQAAPIVITPNSKSSSALRHEDDDDDRANTTADLLLPPTAAHHGAAGSGGGIEGRRTRARSV